MAIHRRILDDSLAESGSSWDHTGQDPATHTARRNDDSPRTPKHQFCHRPLSKLSTQETCWRGIKHDSTGGLIRPVAERDPYGSDSRLVMDRFLFATSLIQNAHGDLITDAAYDFYGVRLALHRPSRKDLAAGSSTSLTLTSGWGDRNHRIGFSRGTCLGAHAIQRRKIDYLRLIFCRSRHSMLILARAIQCLFKLSYLLRELKGAKSPTHLRHSINKLFSTSTSCADSGRKIKNMVSRR
jgi:hypothetical protein